MECVDQINPRRLHSGSLGRLYLPLLSELVHRLVFISGIKLGLTPRQVNLETNSCFFLSD